MARVLADPDEFFLNFSVPTLSARDPQYNAKGYAMQSLPLFLFRSALLTVSVMLSLPFSASLPLPTVFARDHQCNATGIHLWLIQSIVTYLSRN